jgi:photosystem II stability/assembly factor-like uncharacterized protein
MRKIIFTISILLTSNAYSQYFWTEVNSGVTTQLNSASNIDGINAWVCGINGVVLRTTNYGYNWQSVGINGIPGTTTLVNIYGFNNQLALTAGTVGTNTYVYRTSNGGANWAQVFNQANGYVNAVWMSTATNGFMAGNPVSGRWSLWKTTNGGLNWDSTGMFLYTPTSESGFNNSLWINGTKIWFGTNVSRIYYSSNNGANWLAVPTSPLVSSCSIIFEMVATRGFSGGEYLMRSTNGGFNWSSITVPGSGTINNVLCDQYVTGSWFSRSDNNVYGSLNGGINWSFQYSAPAGNYRHMSHVRTGIYNSAEIYAVRTNGGISKCVGIIEGVKLISNEIPKHFELYQNYPNPFNPSTNIKFALPEEGYVYLNVYDVTGRTVARLMNGQFYSVGTYNYVFDAEQYNIASGIYFYKLYVIKQSKQVYSQVKKMVFIK